MSGEPRLCASLVADGLVDDAPEHRTRLHAISGDFAAGHARLTRFFAVVRAVGGGSAALCASLDETERYPDEHRDRFLLLETVELDCMTEGSEAGLLACVEREVDLCGRAPPSTRCRTTWSPRVPC
jgi:hypothetical protein